MNSSQRLEKVAAQLSDISREHRYDPYRTFDWPQDLPAAEYWMSPELMTCFGSDIWSQLSDAQRLKLNHSETIGFFSLNVHLIKDLIGEVVNRIYTTRYPGLSEFFHDFIAEENIHAWFFATFCRRYGGGVLPPVRSIFGSSSGDGVVRDITVFGRILIAEELCDYFNVAMAHDDRLPPICQQINRVHHEDESRHIAFGREMMRALSDEAMERANEEELANLRSYLSRYIATCVNSLYNRAVYADAGLPEPGHIRARLLASGDCGEMRQRILGRTVSFMERLGLVDRAQIAW